MSVQTRGRPHSTMPPAASVYGGSTVRPPDNTTGKATKRKRRKDPSWAKALVVMGAMLMMLSGVAIVGSKVLISQATGSVQQDDLLGGSGKTEAEGGKNLKGPIDMLLLGVDVRATWDKNDTRPDTIMILHVPATHDRAYLISIPRDTEAQIPAFPRSRFGGSTEKINSAFFHGAQNGGGWGGGTQLLAQTIKIMTGISFDGAAIIDFNGFKNVIDALGTVRICVDQPVESHHMWMVDGKPMWIADAKRAGKHGPPVKHRPGCQEMEGWAALDYSRQRYGLKNGDYDRQQHQQQLIKAMTKKAMDGGVMTNPVKLNALIKAAGKAFTLDTNKVPIADFVFTLKGVTANDLTMLRTNGGKFSENGAGREVLNPLSKQMFSAVKNDTLTQFVVANPSVASSMK